MRIVKILVILTAGLFVGCAALNPPDSYYQAQVAIAQEKAKIASLPTQEIVGDFTCNNCSIRSYAPDPQSVANVSQGKNSVDALQIGAVAVSGAAPWVAGAVVAKRVVDGIGDKNYNAQGNLSVRGDEITIDKPDNSVRTDVVTTTKTSVSGESNLGDYSGENSGNQGRIASNDDYTSTPTVVDQPEPVIVDTPDPVVVTQPDPVIVQTPDPVVVPTPDPVIVQPRVIQN